MPVVCVERGASQPRVWSHARQVLCSVCLWLCRCLLDYTRSSRIVSIQSCQHVLPLYRRGNLVTALETGRKNPSSFKFRLCIFLTSQNVYIYVGSKSILGLHHFFLTQNIRISTLFITDFGGGVKST